MTDDEACLQMDLWRGIQRSSYPRVIGKKDVVDLLLEWCSANEYGWLSYSVLRTTPAHADIRIAFVAHVLGLMLLGVEE